MQKLSKRDTAEFFEQLTPKQSLFFTRYMEHGNATKAAMEAYDCKDANSAGAVAHELLRKLKNPVRTFLESKGIDLNLLSRVVVEAMRAEKHNEFTGEKVPDHGIRLKAAERFSKWLGLDTEVMLAVQNNISLPDMSSTFLQNMPHELLTKYGTALSEVDKQRKEYGFAEPEEGEVIEPNEQPGPDIVSAPDEPIEEHHDVVTNIPIPLENVQPAAPEPPYTPPTQEQAPPMKGSFKIGK